MMNENTTDKGRVTNRAITVNHIHLSTFTYFTRDGINRAHVFRDLRTGRVRLVGKLTNESWSELIMASEEDAFSVKGSF
jgi:hypothetical protein